jgi:hypothetical protein
MMRAFVLTVALTNLTACAIEEAPEVATGGWGATAAGSGNLFGGEKIIKVPAGAQTQQELGVQRWELTFRDNGDFGYVGYDQLGHIEHWRWQYLSGGGGNPWVVAETERTFVASRNDQTQLWVSESEDAALWQYEQSVVAAVQRDTRAFYGRRIVAAPTADLAVPAPGTDSGTSCSGEAWDAAAAAGELAVSSALVPLACIPHPSGAQVLACLDAVTNAMNSALGASYAMEDLSQCMDSLPPGETPPQNPPPPPPPGGSNGSGSSSWSWDPGGNGWKMGKCGWNEYEYTEFTDTGVVVTVRYEWVCE